MKQMELGAEIQVASLPGIHNKKMHKKALFAEWVPGDSEIHHPKPLRSYTTKPDRFDERSGCLGVFWICPTGNSGAPAAKEGQTAEGSEEEGGGFGDGDGAQGHIGNR